MQVIISPTAGEAIQLRQFESQITGIVMYRCYLIYHGRIARAEDLIASTLNEAVAQAHELLKTHLKAMAEIWQHADCLYSDHRHTANTGIAACIHSPFATADSTMLPTWRPTRARLFSMTTVN